MSTVRLPRDGQQRVPWIPVRLLPYLATHLTYPEIGSRLFITSNTVKTQALSIYRKLSASSRSTAIERAIEVGLLESSIYPPRVVVT